MQRVTGGAIQSQNLAFPYNTGRKKDYALYRCMVYAVKYADENSNITKDSNSPRVLYDCIVLGGTASGNVITNCRASSDLGDSENYQETVLRPCSEEINKVPLENQDGSVVYVQFNQGDTRFPVIMRCDQGMQTKGKTGIAKADGVKSIREFNGVKTVINKDGILTIETEAGIQIRITQSHVYLGDVDATDFVALASLVLARLDHITNKFNAHTHPVSTTGTAAAQTGTAAITPSPMSAPASVAADLVKAQ